MASWASCAPILAGIGAEGREVYAISTHVGDASALIESLRYHHGLAYSEAQLAGSLLLEGRGGEWRGRHTLGRLLGDSLYRELGVLTLLQECLYLVVGLEALV